VDDKQVETAAELQCRTILSWVDAN